jgi:hypothetical protein
MAAEKLFDYNSSFGVIRTNPRLTGNLKLTLDSIGGVWFNSMDVSPELSSQKYKKFRILTNLEKHNESKKHLNLFEWNKKQLSINSNNSTTKIINLISDIQEKEDKPKLDSLEQLIRNRELELQSYTHIQPAKPIEHIQTMKHIEHIQPIQHVQPIQNKLEEDDIDLSEEIKQTQLSLNLSSSILASNKHSAASRRHHSTVPILQLLPISPFTKSLSTLNANAAL